MKAAYLVKQGEASKAFEIRDLALGGLGKGKVRIAVEAFGLNFADVMARLGLYKDAPPMPAVLGYDAVGRIVESQSEDSPLEVGDRVLAFTRFGGYASHADVDARAVVKIEEDMPAGEATALATQYCTAYYNAVEMVKLHPGDHVLVHAAAGGVGTALVQLAKHFGCKVYGTASAPYKLAQLKAEGVDHAINYKEQDFAEVIHELRGVKGLDVIFDPIGGKTLKKGISLLGAGGRMVSYGASSLNQAKTKLGRIRIGLQFGIYHPAAFIMNSRSLIGVNMLKLADQKPEKLSYIMEKVLFFYKEGILRPKVGGVYPIDQLAEAHHALESRKSTGKLVVTW